MMFDLERRRREERADAPRWLYAPSGNLRAGWRLLLFAMLLAVFSQIVPLAIVPLFAQLSSGIGEPVAAYPWVMLGAVCAALVVSLRVVDDAPWSSIAFGRGAWQSGRLLAGALIGATAITVTAMLLALMGYLEFEVVSVPMIDGVQTSFAVAWIGTAVRLLALLAPAALWEELVFRGYLWKVADDAGGRAVALWSTSVAFGVVHLLNPNAGVQTTLLVILAGVCLGIMRLRLGLAAAWLGHLAWNWVMAAVLHVPVSGIGFATPGYRAEISGPSWLTGGDWGPEGGVVAATVLSGALLLALRGSLRPKWLVAGLVKLSTGMHRRKGDVPVQSERS